ncbi:hypothetical protein [Streptacidiphilus sp. EB129]|uniref:hypothetical protein n=1 Tax=Streptacidiphilus sp. EB129 TaxID=3156262 RepID=UPI0035120933
MSGSRLTETQLTESQAAETQAAEIQPSQFRTGTGTAALAPAFLVSAAPAPGPGATGFGWPLRLLGCVLALLATDPTAWASRPPIDLLLPLLAAAGGFFGAAPVLARPVISGFRLRNRIARHRATVFAVGCVVLLTLHRPPDWLAGCEVVLLLTYLVSVDAAAAGPPGARTARRPWALLAAYASALLVFAAALLPVTDSGAWARLAAAVAVVASGAATAAVLRPTRADRPNRADGAGR